jgi:sugar lactone lactonase YvrE
MSVTHIGLLAACLGIAAGCSPSPAVRFGTREPPLRVQHRALYPETVAYHVKTGRFLVGSMREGAVFEIDERGNTTKFIDDERLCSVLGIAIDPARGRLWLVNSDLGASLKPSVAGAKHLAAVGMYDLASGAPLRYVDLAPLSPGAHLLNGLALDSAGNAYVTDSFSPVIYKIDSNGNASVLLRDQRFLGEGINLNGLVVHPDGYLLVVKKSDGAIFKIPLAHPAAMSEVGISRRFLGGDGLVLVGPGALVVISNQIPHAAQNAAFWLSSEDGWSTAKVDGVQPLGDVYPTGGVLRDGTLYVLHSKLNELIKPSTKGKVSLDRQAIIQPIATINR